ncbi:MAG: [protein-PII] uridylyltransferase [Deltaproteobacteria bacterium]|nr:[protein-PII] uridylyltransferase [Deltaproteobacteria bacterium]
MQRSSERVQKFISEKDSLAEKFLRSETGLRFCHRYADLVDHFVHDLFKLAGFKEANRSEGDDALVIIALGSYGRRELCLGSDIDLMVLHQGALSSQMEQVIRDSLYPLWDARLELGYSILTFQECIRFALENFKMLTSLVDSRFLLGSRSFYRLYLEAFWSRMDREKTSLLGRFLISRRERAEHNRGEGCFVEPDLKEGLGGLRDIHLMAWMARIWFDCKRLGQIKRFAAFRHFEIQKLGVSRSFLLKIRNYLHWLAHREEDTLGLAYQDRIAKILDYRDGLHISGPEKLMRDVYFHLNRVRYRHEEFQEKMLDVIDPSPEEPFQGNLAPLFEVRKGKLVLREGSLFEKDPLVLLKGFKEASDRELFLGSGFIWEAQKIIREKGETLTGSPEGKVLFRGLLMRPENSKIIRLALEIGLIGLFIPEFRKIRNLHQFGFYHVMTVDLHSLRVAEVITEISKNAYDEKWPVLRSVFEQVENQGVLFLAALLHDIGKGYGEGHCERGAKLIPAILSRLGFDDSWQPAVSFLVEHHLLMPRVAQHRDLGEEKTCVQVAQVIQDKQFLKMLFLISFADSFATGPMARSDWKIMLLTELFSKVERILDRDVLATPDATEKIHHKREHIRKTLMKDFEERAVQHILDQVPSRYILNTSTPDMVVQFSLALSMGEERNVWRLKKRKSAPVTRVIQVTYDRPGLFSKMAGVLALNNMAVLSASIFTLKNGLAFDTYEVTNPPDQYRETEQWDKARHDFEEALEDHLALDQLIQEKRDAGILAKYERPIKKKVVIDNEESDFFTLIEITAGARVGLLYDLACVIFRLDLDIQTAKVNSDGEKMTGVFYVRQSTGEKVYETAAKAEVKSRLMGAL